MQTHHQNILILYHDMLISELHRKTVLQLYRSLTRGATHLPLLLKPDQKDLVHTFRDQLQKRFRREAPLARNFQRAHSAISTAVEWDTLLCHAFEDPKAVPVLVGKLSHLHDQITEQKRRDEVDEHLEEQFSRCENNQNAMFPDFVEDYTQKVLSKAQNVPLSPEEQQHRDSQRLHTVLLRRLRSRIPQRAGRSQPLFTQCVLSANRNHQRELYKRGKALKRRERGPLVRDHKGSNIQQLVFHRPRHRLAPQSWLFGRVVSRRYTKHGKLISQVKELEKSNMRLSQEIGGKLKKGLDPRGDVMRALFAKSTEIKRERTAISDKLNHMKMRLASEYPITMRRIRQHQKVEDRRHPEQLRKARSKYAQLRADSNLGRLYR
ncbi:hypothetical protein CJU89_2632 [Yarrowia sp. B02]|nr:hypothetical protein CJU89_2632 [Yarrowia sp. B02]